MKKTYLSGTPIYPNIYKKKKIYFLLFIVLKGTYSIQTFKCKNLRERK